MIIIFHGLGTNVLSLLLSVPELLPKVVVDVFQPSESWQALLVNGSVASIE